MKVILTETQVKNLINKVTTKKEKEIKELSKNSTGVEEFIDKVKETKGLLKHLGFDKIKDLEDYIIDNNYRDFNDLKTDARKFNSNKD